jgi:hypothetical protein
MPLFRKFVGIFKAAGVALRKRLLGGPSNFVEDVFSCFLYTGNGSTQTITNNIDLSTKGGLVWIKNRSTTADHGLWDTARGATKRLRSNTTDSQNTEDAQVTGFTSSGFTLGTDGASNSPNFNESTFASWTFRKQPKFFDVVTYTGTGANRTISHNLGSVPGCIIVKRTDTTADWAVYHRSLANTQYLVLNTTAAAATGATWWNSTTPTSSVFSLGTDASVNASGGTYVAYLWAHDAGGFGLTGADNVISCGSFTYDGSVGVSVTLGYEPQWIMYKSSTAIGGGTNWIMHDMMRGMPVPTATTATLAANNSGAESSSFARAYPTANGFTLPSGLGAADDYIYIAIRRGPMKVPTTGTSVFTPSIYSGDGGTTQTLSSVSNVTDLNLTACRNTAGWVNPGTNDRLRGVAAYLQTPETAAELASSAYSVYPSTNTQTQLYAGQFVNSSGKTFVNYSFSRAPGYFDVVCYTGAFPSNVTVNHNLGVTPEFIITKARSTAGYDWRCYHSALGIGTTIRLNLTNAASVGTQYVSVSSTNFVVGNSGDTDNNGTTYVSYLFATCAGVSKVGSYTGTATTKQIDCGFTAGARFVLIKRTDSTGDWYVWDSARGIVAGNDPYLLLNTTDAEVTNTDYIDPYSAGFELSSTAPAAINANGGTYIFLAIA